MGLQGNWGGSARGVTGVTGMPAQVCGAGTAQLGLRCWGSTGGQGVPVPTGERCHLWDTQCHLGVQGRVGSAAGDELGCTGGPQPGAVRWRGHGLGVPGGCHG